MSITESPMSSAPHSIIRSCNDAVVCPTRHDDDTTIRASATLQRRFTSRTDTGSKMLNVLKARHERTLFRTPSKSRKITFIVCA